MVYIEGRLLAEKKERIEWTDKQGRRQAADVVRVVLEHDGAVAVGLSSVPTGHKVGEVVRLPVRRVDLEGGVYRFRVRV